MQVSVTSTYWLCGNRAPDCGNLGMLSLREHLQQLDDGGDPLIVYVDATENHCHVRRDRKSWARIRRTGSHGRLSSACTGTGP